MKFKSKRKKLSTVFTKSFWSYLYVGTFSMLFWNVRRSKLVNKISNINSVVSESGNKIVNVYPIKRIFEIADYDQTRK